MSIESTYAWFDAAMQYFADKKGYGFQTFVAQKAGVSSAYVNQVLRYPDKYASFSFQVSIAEALGFTYEDFLRFGRELIEGQQVKRPFPTKEAEDLATTLLKFLSNTNWRMLQRQKRAMTDCLSLSPQSDLLEGLLNFLDCIQDWAVDTYGLSEEVVFDRQTESNGG